MTQVEKEKLNNVVNKIKKFVKKHKKFTIAFCLVLIITIIGGASNSNNTKADDKSNNNSNSMSETAEPEVSQLEKPDIEKTVRVACQTAWYNNGGDSDQETYWGVQFRNQEDIDGYVISAEFPVYMYNNPDKVFGWYLCEYNYKDNVVIQITDIEFGSKLL